MDKRPPGAAVPGQGDLLLALPRRPTGRKRPCGTVLEQAEAFGGAVGGQRPIRCRHVVESVATPRRILRAYRTD